MKGVCDCCGKEGAESGWIVTSDLKHWVCNKCQEIVERFELIKLVMA